MSKAKRIAMLTLLPAVMLAAAAGARCESAPLSPENQAVSVASAAGLPGASPYDSIQQAVSGFLEGKFRRFRKQPVLTPGPPDAWDAALDRLSITRSMSTYYLYYTGTNAAGQAQVGLATSTDLINWTKEPSNPVLTIGAPGEWDDLSLGETSVIYEPRTGQWEMWYRGKNRKTGRIQIGLATSNDGVKWVKHSANPVIPNGAAGEFDSYMAEDPAVLRHNGIYYMTYSAMQDDWATHRVGLATSADGIAWAKRGEILSGIYKPGTGTAGFILINKLYRLGDVILARYESCTEPAWNGPISGGFLLTSDFINWVDATRYPVVIPQTGSPSYSIASPTLLPIPELLVLDHDDDVVYGLEWGGWGNFGGVPLFVAPRQEGSLVTVEMLSLPALSGGAMSSLDDSLGIDLNRVRTLAITVEGGYGPSAAQPVRVHIRSSVDGVAFDTADLLSFDGDLVAGGAGRKTLGLEPAVRFVKVIVENPDSSPVNGVRVTVTMGR